MPYSSPSSSQPSSSLKAVRNRVYAQRSRQRHRNYVSCLELERQELLQRLERLEAENRVMRQLIQTGSSNNNNNSEVDQINEQIFNQVCTQPTNTSPVLPNTPAATPHIFSPIPTGMVGPAPSPVFFSDFSHSTASSVMLASRSFALDSPLTVSSHNFLVNGAEWMEGNEVMNWLNGRSRAGLPQRMQVSRHYLGPRWSLSF